MCQSNKRPSLSTIALTQNSLSSVHSFRLKTSWRIALELQGSVWDIFLSFVRAWEALAPSLEIPYVDLSLKILSLNALISFLTHRETPVVSSGVVVAVTFIILNKWTSNLPFVSTVTKMQLEMFTSYSHWITHTWMYFWHIMYLLFWTMTEL